MKRVSLVLILLLVLAPPLLADRGGIPFKPHVKIFEPNQRAMIAWNGTEQILLLSTDLKTSEPTEVLEVLPLPTEPKVTKGDLGTFRRATELINKKIRRPPPPRAAKGRVGAPAAPKRPAGEVTFHKKIGAHDISVTHVLSTEGFIEWVEAYLKSKGVKNPTIPGAMKKLITEYLREGFAWFVFDVVSLDEELKTHDAIQYRFKTKFLYYPMKISSTGSGHTSVELLILTPKLLSKFTGIPASRVDLRHEPISITAGELKSLHSEMAALLGHREDMKLRIWRIQGELSSFDRDLIAH